MGTGAPPHRWARAGKAAGSGQRPPAAASGRGADLGAASRNRLHTLSLRLYGKGTRRDGTGLGRRGAREFKLGACVLHSGALQPRPQDVPGLGLQASPHPTGTVGPCSQDLREESAYKQRKAPKRGSREIRQRF